MITRHDNGDGTTTFKGVSVTIPTIVAEKFDVVAVRRATEGEQVSYGDVVTVFGNGKTATSLPILKPRPTWKPPASLKPGKYEWQGEYLNDSGFSAAWASKHLRDWTDPPKTGYWQVHEDGTATYLGES